MKENTRKLIGNGIKIVLAVLLFIFIFRAFQKNWADIRDYDYSTIRWSYIFLSGLILAVTYTLFGAWWAFIIRGHGERIGYITGAGIFFLSNLFRYVPGKVMQGVSMIYLANRKGVTIHTAISATFIQQILYLLSGLTVGLVLLPGDWISDKIAFLNYFKYLALIMVVLIYPPVLSRLMKLAVKLIKRDIPDIDMPFRNIVLYYVIGIVLWLFNGAGLTLFFIAFQHIPANLLPGAIAIFPTGYVIAFMTLVAPGGIGIREGIFAYLLRNVLVEPLNITVAALTRFIITVVEIVVVLPFLYLYFRRPKYFLKDTDEHKDQESA